MSAGTFDWEGYPVAWTYEDSRYLDVKSGNATIFSTTAYAGQRMNDEKVRAILDKSKREYLNRLAPKETKPLGPRQSAAAKRAQDRANRGSFGVGTTRADLPWTHW